MRVRLLTRVRDLVLERVLDLVLDLDLDLVLDFVLVRVLLLTLMGAGRSELAEALRSEGMRFTPPRRLR